MSKKKSQHSGRIYRDEYKKQVSMYEFESQPEDSGDILMQRLPHNYTHSDQLDGNTVQNIGNTNGYLGRQRAASEKHTPSRDQGQKGRKGSNSRYIDTTNIDISRPISHSVNTGVGINSKDPHTHSNWIFANDNTDKTPSFQERQSSMVNIQNANTSNKKGRSGSKGSRHSNKSLTNNADQKPAHSDIIRGGSSKHHGNRDRSNTESVGMNHERPSVERVEISVSETELVNNIPSNHNQINSRKSKNSQKTADAFNQLVQENSGHDEKKGTSSDKRHWSAHRKSTESITTSEDGKRVPTVSHDNPALFNVDGSYGYDNSNTKTKYDRQRSRQSSGSSRKSGSKIKSGRRSPWNSAFTGFDFDTNDPRYAKFRKNVEQRIGRYNKESTDDSGGYAVTQCHQRRSTILLTVIVLILLGVIAALLIVFVFPNALTSNPGLHDMSRAHVKLHILNRDYGTAMSHTSSVEFKDISIPFCKEIDNTFITSVLVNEYYGCDTVSLSRGSVRLYYTSPFVDTPSTSNVTLLREILVNQPEKGVYTSHGKVTVMIGKFLVDVKSIEISFEKYQSINLPQKPTFHILSVSATTVSAETASTEEPQRQLTTAVTPALLNSTTSDSVSTVFSTGNISHTTLMPSTKTNATVNSITTVSSKSFATSTPSSVLTPTQTGSVTNMKTAPVTSAYMSIPRKHISTTAYYSRPPSTRVAISSMVTMNASTTSRLYTNTGHMANGTDINSVTPSMAIYIQTTVGPQQPGLIIMVSKEVRLLEEPASVTCHVKNIKAIEKITIYQSHASGTQTLVVEVNATEIHTQWTRLSNTTFLNVVWKDSVILIDVNFTSLSCEETGNYTCLVDAGEVQLSASGYLHGTALPGRPHLKLPIALIEEREISITCTANVGFPSGTIRWQIKPKAMSNFIPFEDQILSSSGQCNTYVTSSIIYTPTRDGDGTLLKCLVENDHVELDEDFTQVAELQILPASLCDGVSDNTTLRHPFTCTLYVRCHGDGYDVIECKNNLCYDVAYGQCGHSAISMTSVVAYLNEAVTSLKCRLLHMGSWSHVTVSKVTADGDLEPILTATSELKTTLYETAMKDRLFVDIEVKTQYEVEVRFWVYVLTCEDQGEYVCETDPSNFATKARGTIKLKVKPEAPKITMPHEIIEDFPLRTEFTCRADVGYPYGHLAWTIKSGNESQFYPLTYNVTSEIKDTNCSRVMTISFDFLPKLSHNGMKIRCELENTATLPGGHKLVAVETIHVVPGNFCATHVEKVPQVHPYDCHQYVQCAEGYMYVQRCGSKYCFNPETLRCDSAPEIVTEEVDPNHPCRPNQNGVFLPHPFLCNKYIWCVQGVEIVQHCPMGTLYIDGGHCTFDPNQSRCYKDAW